MTISGASMPPRVDAESHRASFVSQMRMVPGAVAIVCSAEEGQRSGLAATAWNSVCADPPMLLVCVNRSASAHDLILRSGAFSVNLLDSSDTETVAIFSAQRGLNGADRFVAGAWEDGPMGQPMLKRSVASFECQVEEHHQYGTHSVFIGLIHDMRARAEGDPLVYMKGSYCRATNLEEAVS
ncbi:flavin reductase family protein [Novosphingobium sp. 9U]|uniref:flavin reductase family protein n=1 Tax=Novosphingobium sp. 9U TaxID=2653158 RepID=UPI0012F2BEC4|nr:flavin reductase family protein [Novosphingobium sp. 9U]VWX54169.1 Flavin reductase [Novosphingobium sp. 9U]